MNSPLSFKEAIRESRSLWDLSFPDEGEYTDFYFNRRCTKDVMLCLHKTKDTFDSAFQLFPYKMNLKGIPTHTLYMSGVCTRPDMRGKGYMELCMKENLAQLTDGEATLVTLIPANEKLFTYYHRFGFTEIAARQITEYHEKTGQSGNKHLHTEKIPVAAATAEQRHSIYQMFRQKWESMPSSIIHTEQDFQDVLDAYIPDNLHLLSCYPPDKKQELTAAVLCSERTSEIFVHDFATTREDDTTNVLSYLYPKADTQGNCHEGKTKPVRFFSYESKPFMMARILNPKKAIALYSETSHNENIHIHLTDKLLESNSGYYSTTSDKVVKTEKPVEGIQYTEMTPEQLTAHMFHNTTLHASLMLDY
ncbi:MAG: GNAT family N-acetyltransferase [Prevotellaceae bacterium]|nr:GNAT family N-acetyltransferase [Prevotellaceae bacterium]